MRQLFLFLFLLGGAAYPAGSSVNSGDIFFGSPSQISVTTVNSNLPYGASAAVSVLPQNSLREYLLIQNVGSTAAYVSFGAPKSASGSFTIAAGGNYEPAKAPANQVFMIVPTGAQVLVMEGQ